MPTFVVFYKTKLKGINKLNKIKLQAIDETHMRLLMFNYAKKVLKKFIEIIDFKVL